MSKLEELIKELCPNGVEYKYLGDICEIKTGKGITKKDITENGKYPIISGGKEPMGLYHLSNRKANTVTISRVGANSGFVNYIEVDFYLNDKCFSIIPISKYEKKIDSKYIYEYLKNNEEKISAMQSEGGVPTINTKKVSSIAIAVPPLEVQREIVRILDSFTLLTKELIKELAAELTARKKQYEYYRNELISINIVKSNVSKLNEIAEIYDGTHQTPEYKSKGIPFISVENIDDIYSSNKFISEEAYSKYKIKPQVDDLFMTRIGSIGKCAIMTQPKDLAYYVSLALIRPNKKLLDVRYLKHYIESSLGTKELAKRTLHHAVPIKITVPPLEVQREIVRILDSFTLLTKELIKELAAELTARKKQYEYYRNELISINIVKSNVSKLNEIAEIYDGTHQTPEYKSKGIPFISVENIDDIYSSNKFISEEAYSKYKIKPQVDDLFMTRIGSIGKCAIMTQPKDLAYYVSLALIRPNKKLLDVRYLKHYIESSLGTKELAKRTLHHAVPIKINKDDIGKIVIKYPTIDIQRRIADVLDNFDAICSDLKIGLPAEIEARQKQYEYYRDLLLTFAETGKIIATDRQTDRQAIIKLIQYVFGYCPVKLDDIATIIRGGNLQKKDFVENGKPCIHYGQIYTHFGVSSDKTLTFVNDEVFEKSKTAKTDRQTDRQ